MQAGGKRQAGRWIPASGWAAIRRSADRWRAMMHPHSRLLDTPTNIKIGTCAWSYDDWRGVFYPEHFPSGERLEFYSKYLPAVEVDSTFYRAPTEDAVAHWAAVTPDDFAFACKLPKAITHELRLRDAAKPLEAFLASLEPLGKKLWCVVAQLPPSFRPKRDEAALRTFIQRLPGHMRFAFEFRHAEWHAPRIAHLLEEHGIARVWNDLTPLDHQKEGAFEFLPDTADFLYVRLMGDLDPKYSAHGKRVHRYTRLQWPREAALESWSVRLRQAAANHKRVFVAVSNHFEGYAPHTAQRLAERLGLPITMPNLAALDGDEGGEQIDLL
jgi:uncharacterized protein YecE (DUF72 family)